jgi:3-isopropylmalate/(R)-2-methylmalate dehydratase small subunit
MKNFSGKVLILDRSDINTDEIIPAKYLTEATKAALKPYCLEDLKLPGFDPRKDIAGKAAIVTRANFGCGSSREHAPWALEMNGINLVVAEGFARIFRQNMFNSGLMAVALPKETIAEIFKRFAGEETEVSVDLGSMAMTFSSGKDSMKVAFAVDPFDLELVKAGGWVDYADKKY